MDNRKMLTEFLDAFDRNDYEGILQRMTDDVYWEMPGEQHAISGKEAMRKFFQDHADMKLVSSTRTRFILEGDQASVSGEALCRNDKTGEAYDMYYCDIYDLQGGKVKNMVTYNHPKKK